MQMISHGRKNKQMHFPRKEEQADAEALPRIYTEFHGNKTHHSEPDA
jgi:hypothetical protein